MPWFKFGQKDNDRVSTAPVESVDVIRRRAKNRLIGTVVLVLAGVIGFPFLFDSQPRPVSVDTPIVIPDKTKVKPLAVPPALPAAVVPQPAPAARVDDSASLASKEEIVQNKPEALTSISREATKTVADPVVAAEKTKTEAAAREKEARAKEMKEKELKDKELKGKAAREKEAKEKEAARAKALLDGASAKPESQASATLPAAGEGRFVVQFGAFSEPDKAQEARRKVEKTGLKTYTQVAETPQGKRIRARVGPFGTKAEAEKAATKIKALDLPAAVLAL